MARSEASQTLHIPPAAAFSPVQDSLSMRKAESSRCLSSLLYACESDLN
jgi:hypothetical protein